MNHTVTSLLNTIKNSLARAGRQFIQPDNNLDVLAKMYADTMNSDLKGWKYDPEKGLLDMWLVPRKPIEYIQINFTTNNVSWSQIFDRNDCPE